MNATLDTLAFVGDGSTATYTLTAMPGWFGGVEMRHASTPRPNGHGDFDAPTYQSGRIITLQGQVQTDDAASFDAALQALEDLLADGSMAALTVVQAAATYTIDVRRHGAVDLDVVVYGHVARYQLQLWAPNPAKELVP